MKNLLIVTGGASAERDVSIKSCDYVTQFIDRDIYNIIRVTIAKDKTWVLEKNNQPCYLLNKNGKCVLLDALGNDVLIDLIFPIVLGDAEDGSLQGYFESLSAPYVGNNILSSVLCFDKISSKYIMSSEFGKKEGVLCVPFIVFQEGMTFQEACLQLNSDQLFVKASNSGSTFGVNKVSNEGEFKLAIEDARLYDKDILIEKSLANVREVFCGIISFGGEFILSSIGEAMVGGECFSYDLKYNVQNLIQPAKLNDLAMQKIYEQSIFIFKTLRCNLFARIDFFIYEDDIYFSEVNTVPGMTENSIFLKLMKWADYDEKTVINMLLHSCEKV